MLLFTITLLQLFFYTESFACMLPSVIRTHASLCAFPLLRWTIECDGKLVGYPFSWPPSWLQRMKKYKQVSRRNANDAGCITVKHESLTTLSITQQKLFYSSEWTVTGPNCGCWWRCMFIEISALTTLYNFWASPLFHLWRKYIFTISPLALH